MTDQSLATQEKSIATVNEQIVELDLERAANDDAIEVMEVQIRKLKRRNSTIDRQTLRLREKRQVFVRAAADLKALDMP